MNLFRKNVEYKIKLSEFEGPLDLLLHVIKESKLDIKTVPLASVTGQYMEHLSGLDELDLDLASEFVEVGATLIEIKTRQILPRPVTEEEESPEEAENRLRAQLEEYKLLKEASEKLKIQENVNRFYKDPEPIKEIVKYRMDNLGLDMLIEAFTRILHKVEKKAAPVLPKSVRLDRFTVSEKMSDIRTRLAESSSITFSQLFDSDFTKSEVINTFLAVLEMLKNGEVLATQDEEFAEITLKKGTINSDFKSSEFEAHSVELSPTSVDSKILDSKEVISGYTANASDQSQNSLREFWSDSHSVELSPTSVDRKILDSKEVINGYTVVDGIED